MIDLVLRSVLAPGVLAGRWFRATEAFQDDPLPIPQYTLGLLAKALLDEVFFVTEVLSIPLVSVSDSARLHAEATDALELYTARGWLDDPRDYHREPPALVPNGMRRAESRGLSYQHLTFESGYAPHEGEPGRDRWLGYARNRTGHAWVLEHPGPPRPWLVCVHGYRMGFPLADFLMFPAAWLHRVLGLNLVFPVLPLHGPRTEGRRTGDGFLSGDYLDTIHLQAQAIWDIRSLLRWLREDRDATTIGTYGLSLGGVTSALLAAFEPDIQCAIAGIPAVSHTGIARWNVPPFVLQLSEYIGLAWERLERLVRVVSPLAFPPLVPRERRFLYAGTADRLVPLEGVRDLWLHWERPRLDWYEGSHVSSGWEVKVRTLLAEALQETGMVAAGSSH